MGKVGFVGLLAGGAVLVYTAATVYQSWKGT